MHLAAEGKDYGHASCLSTGFSENVVGCRYYMLHEFKITINRNFNLNKI
jgi:hypothetical protein